ncbi:hypothetical protein TNCV_964901 [Trichonephila clavipes]|nr:hypothetical protein TNCV_964901 [Trichonephila clavipes]
MINGRTRLHVVENETMTGQRYIDEVLLPHVRLFRVLQVAGRNYPRTNKNTLIRALTEEWDKLLQQLLDNVVQKSSKDISEELDKPHIELDYLTREALVEKLVFFFEHRCKCRGNSDHYYPTDYDPILVWARSTSRLSTIILETLVPPSTPFFNFNSKTILVGDFNAKHTSWVATVATPETTSMEEHLTSLDTEDGSLWEPPKRSEGRPPRFCSRP